MNTNRGSVSITGMLALFFVSSYLIFQCYQGKITLDLVQHRANKYLCLRNYLRISKKYVGQIGKINIAIAAAQASSMIPGAAAAAKATISGLKITQDLIHLRYIKNILGFSSCSKLEKAQLLGKLPYKTVALWKLKRNPAEITLIRQKKWQIIIPISQLSILKSKLKLASSLSTKIKSKTVEWP